jgi:outer membrane lipoprotein SlyB
MFWNNGRTSRFLGVAVAALAIAVFSNVKAQTLSSSNVGTNEARHTLGVEAGVVIDTSAATIEREARNETRAAGAAVGAALGAVVADRGKTSWVKTSLLGLAGGLTGDAIARRASEENLPAQQVVVKLDNGRLMAVIQQVTDSPLAVGERVYVVQGVTTRVVRNGAVSAPASTVQQAPATSQATGSTARSFPVTLAQH